MRNYRSHQQLLELPSRMFYQVGDALRAKGNLFNVNIARGCLAFGAEYKHARRACSHPWWQQPAQTRS